MKFIMVILICISGQCQNLFEEHLYDSKAECEAEGAVAKQYMMETYPSSSGEIWCLTTAEFQEYWQYLEQQEQLNKPDA
jgi:hypothetical protein